MRDAISLEEAAHAVNQINARARAEKREQREKERQPSLSPTLDGWLKKEVP